MRWNTFYKTILKTNVHSDLFQYSYLVVYYLEIQPLYS